jgi:integrase
MAGSLIVKGNKYYAKFRINGKQKLLATGIAVKGNNKRKAEKVMHELIAEYEKLDMSKVTISFLTYLDTWLAKMNGVLKPSTWETYDKTIHGKVFPYFKTKDIRLLDLSPSDLTDYFKYLSVNGKSNCSGGLCEKSVKNIRGVISSALDDAVTDKYITTNPVTESHMPSFENDIEREVPQYNADEIRTLLKYAKEHESHIYVFLLLALFTGLRKGELLALTWNDINFKNNMLTVNKSRTGARKAVTALVTTPKTKSSNRTIPLNDNIIDALKVERKKQQEFCKLSGIADNSYIIRTISGKPYSNLSAINRVVNRLTEKAGLPHCTIHGFRHSVASILDDNGIPLRIYLFCLVIRT